MKWRLCSANGHWYGRVNPYRVDKDPRVGALAELIPLKEGRRRVGWTLYVEGRFVNTHGQLKGAKQRATQEFTQRYKLRRYVTVCLTIAQAQAAYNACDLIRDEYEASEENKHEAAQYKRAKETIGRALNRG